MRFYKLLLEAGSIATKYQFRTRNMDVAKLNTAGAIADDMLRTVPGRAYDVPGTKNMHVRLVPPSAPAPWPNLSVGLEAEARASIRDAIPRLFACSLEGVDLLVGALAYRPDMILSMDAIRTVHAASYHSLEAQPASTTSDEKIMAWASVAPCLVIAHHVENIVESEMGVYRFCSVGGPLETATTFGIYLAAAMLEKHINNNRDVSRWEEAA